MSQKIVVKELMGERCSQRLSPNGFRDGRFLRDVILYELQRNDSLEVDLNGIVVMTPSFADEAFGKLLYDYSSDQLTKQLKFIIGTAEPHIVNRINSAVSNRSAIIEAEKQKKQGNHFSKESVTS